MIQSLKVTFDFFRYCRSGKRRRGGGEKNSPLSVFFYNPLEHISPMTFKYPERYLHWLIG